MLRFLRIKRLAVIDSVEVEFAPGLNVLTGETGAGKSILVEAVGLMFRVSWAGWLTIGESAFFIPIEIYELLHLWANPERRGSPITVLIILPLNIFIVWYLFQNRDRLFRHILDQSAAFISAVSASNDLARKSGLLEARFTRYRPWMNAGSMPVSATRCLYASTSAGV